MTELTNLSETDANNTTITGANIAEGCNPSEINNAIRNTLGLIRRAFKASIFRLRDTTDQSKMLAFNLSGIATATTRTITVPDASGTLVLKDSSGHVTGIVDFTHTGIFTHDGTAGDITMAATGADITFSRNGPNAVQALGGTSATLDLKGYNGINFGTGSSGTTNGRVDSSGNLLIGKTAIDDSTSGASIRASGQASLTANGSAPILSYRYTSDGEIQRFHRNSSAVGNISVTASATAYNTSSDYRLPWKVGAEPLTGSGYFIDSLKPYYFPVVGHAGFFAHEFAEVSAVSVTGEKDAVDEEGQPVYQSMQASTADVIANLVAEIQSLRARVTALEGA